MLLLLFSKNDLCHFTLSKDAKSVTDLKLPEILWGYLGSGEGYRY